MTKRADDLGALRVGLADDAGLDDGRVLQQRRLHLERADPVRRGGDHVVLAALEPDVAVGVAARTVAGVVPAADEALGGGVRVAVIAGEQPVRARVRAHGYVGDLAVGRGPPGPSSTSMS
jgi:hypothetical protein